MTGDTPPAFSVVCDMEGVLSTLDDLLLAVMLLGQSLENDDGTAISAVATEAKKATLEADKMRQQLFRLMHPKRSHFDRVGWPGDQRAPGKQASP